MKTFYCTNCGFVCFFENFACGNCGALLGFSPDTMDMAAFEPDGDGGWRRLGAADEGSEDVAAGSAFAESAGAEKVARGADATASIARGAPAANDAGYANAPPSSPALAAVPGDAAAQAGEADGDRAPARVSSWRQCRNYSSEQICNWMVAPGDDEALCRCCRRTEHTAALEDPANKDAWFKLEGAKRRLFYSLYRLGLPVEGDGTHPPPEFRFLGGEGETATTGHAGGTITLDIGEADDARREQRRVDLREPYRTLLGHFRHEIGHYYWDRLIAHGGRLEAFRKHFGDERRDYAEALAAYYASPPADWAERHISAYAAMHPWEDWAETWAHYLHISDALDTAAHWGFALHSDQADGGPADVPGVEVEDQPFRKVLLEQWLPLAQFLNSMGRSLGQGDAYPFVMATTVLDKLGFVHRVVTEAAAARRRGTDA
ncbi:hypothetical protein dqs_1942 [Azoarcus olearius]|uniref:zinc-binding metallopeptidase family protein n=1 Tax=Azoarcus sp. (strain BH72) TaxID=418699 RepID=UPI0008062450|nr:putative zinc-binding metallopeptidase [Azoarcus olearius]ANQ84980.1 hypothetical protein dqs_1942 [Azoarcus olearius]